MQARELLRESRRRGLSSHARWQHDPRRFLFAKQLEVYDLVCDECSIITSRRSGKSTLFSALAVRGCIRYHARDVVVPYFALTRKNARLYFWPILKQLVLQCGIPMRRGLFGETALTCQPFDGGATIVCLGADDRKDVELVRGGKFGPALIDECGAIPSHVLESLEDTLRPGQMDLGAPIYRGGTPGIALSGYWYDLTRPDRTTPNNVAAWTMRDNPHLRDVDAFLEREKLRRGWTDETPSFIREYGGKWNAATELLVYPYMDERNAADIDQLPSVLDPAWSFVIAIDPAQVQETGITVLGAHRFDPNVYIFHSEKASGLLSEQVAARVRELQAEFPRAAVIMDTGGIGAQHARELTVRFGIPVEPAVKKERFSAVRILSDDVRAGKVKVLRWARCDKIRAEWSVLQWDEDKLDHNKKQCDVATGMKLDHCSDAAIYGHRRIRHYAAAPKITKPLRGTREWLEEEERRLWEERARGS